MDALLKENEKLKEIALGVGPSYVWMASARDSGLGLNKKDELSTSVHLCFLVTDVISAAPSRSCCSALPSVVDSVPLN